MSFNSIATKIIKDSIVSTVYIDDNIVEPFDVVSNENEKYYNVSKGLYKSFREENKSIDFYKFVNFGDWQTAGNQILKNRDLLVLDWDLVSNNQISQPNTFKILKQAVDTDNLHFVSIYTETPEKSFPDILYFLKANFDLGFNQNSKDVYNNLILDIEAQGIDTSFIKDTGGKFKEIALGRNSVEVIAELKEIFQAELKNEYKLFARCLRNIDGDITKACEILGYCINDELIPEEKENFYAINYEFANKNFIVVNNTIIQLTNKNNPTPNDHFSFFTNALISVCGNLLTLTSLEIRNLLRESSGFIGKDADGINECALFHHQSKKESFFDFITDVWKSQTLSFVDYNSDKLKTLNREFWDIYQEENMIAAKTVELKKNEVLFFNELAKLNIYYNSLQLSKLATDKIKFGDVFIELNSENLSNGNFWLNISAHCDCVEPLTNLKNNFYFIKGNSTDLKQSLLEGDSGFNSYVRSADNIVSIKWNQRPIVLNIHESSMVDFIVTTKDGLFKDVKLKYLCTLKENYTQRMANNSFSFAMRVGIDFATI